MWKFLGSVLEQGGIVALAFAALGIGFAVVVRALWQQNQKLHKQLSDDRERYTLNLERISKEHAETLAGIQERRINEAKAITERFVDHVSKMDRALDRISASLGVLIEVSRGGGRGGT